MIHGNLQGRPGLKVTGASCNRGHFSAAIKAVLTNFCVNEYLVTTFNLNSGSYCSCRRQIFSNAIPIFWPKSEFLDFRTFRSAAFRSQCEFLFPMHYYSKICIASPKINGEYSREFFQNSAFSYLVGLGQVVTKQKIPPKNKQVLPESYSAINFLQQ